MTNREAVIAEVNVPIEADNAINKALIDFSIDAESEYNGSVKEEVGLAAIQVLKTLLSTSSISEGGYTIKLQIEKRILDLQTEYGTVPIEVIEKPKIRAFHGW